MKNPQRLIRELYSSTHNPETDDRKTRFAGLNQFVTARHGWLTSIPGESEVTMETLEGSSLPDELKRLGYDVRETGEGQRILPHAIVQCFVTCSDGEFEPLVEGSSKPVASTVTHAGIVRVLRFAFGMP
jgi:hypothetical protein